MAYEMYVLLYRSILANGSLLITSLVRTRETRPEEGIYQCVATLDGTGSILSRFAKIQAACKLEKKMSLFLNGMLEMFLTFQT
jgi:hypothetical protein